MWIHCALLFTLSQVIAAFNLTIIHTNDVHARYEETNKYSGPCSEKSKKEGACFGGYARLVNKVKDLRNKYPNSLVLDGGDQFQGTTWFYQFGWNVTQYFMNYLGYDAMALGNHEFDNGIKGLVPFLERTNFSVLSSNIDSSLEPTITGKFKKSVVLTVGVEKIAIIGYTTTETTTISSTGKLTFSDEVESVKKEVEAIKKKDSTINKFIALGHAGFDMDTRIAKEVDDIDIVVGGHSNTFLYTGTYPSNEKPVGDYPFVVTKLNGKKALCVQDYAYGKYLGFLNVIFNDDGDLTQWLGNPILLDSSVAQDNETLSIMEPWREEVKKFTLTVQGSTKVFLQGDATVCRKQECNLGNVISDSMLRYNLRDTGSSDWNNISIVLMNSGGIRSPVGQGNITVEQILTVLPFRNSIDTIDLKGVHLKGTLEHSVSTFSPGQTDLKGGFLQFSGLRVQYNINKPVGNRVVDVQVLCTECEVPTFEPLDTNKVYRIIVSNFIANGGDGYTIIKENKMNHIEKGDLDSDIFTDYIKKFSPVIQGLDGRIQFVTENEINKAPLFIISPFLFIFISVLYLL